MHVRVQTFRLSRIILLQPFAHHVGHFSGELLGICAALQERSGIQLTAVTSLGVPSAHYSRYKELGVILDPDRAVPDDQLAVNRHRNITLGGQLTNLWLGNVEPFSR